MISFAPNKLSVALAISLGFSLSNITQAQFSNPMDLSDINGSNGIVIHGANSGDYSGTSVSAAGDINGDGIDDVIMGAYGADPNGHLFAGSSYVVFGSSIGLPNPFNLSNINSLNGIVIHGENDDDRSGRPVSAAGDINGDGIDDVIIGASGADPNGNLDSGSSYVVFGSASGLPSPLNLSSINGTNGFVIHGENAGDRSGFSVSAASDINGDGIDDIIIGADFADPNGRSLAGSSYVVFGSASGLPNPFNLSTINGANGFVIHGENAGDRSGTSVSAAGDINGDGIDDVIIGATAADSNGNIAAGSSYVVFGSASGLPNPFNLSTINSLNGFVIHGENAGDRSGRSVSAAGDINGDGIDDVIIGATNANSSYVVFGSASGLPNPFNLSSINGSNGFVIHGDVGHHSGRSVSAAGDINADGIDDVIIGTTNANSNGNLQAGSSYVVFGNSSGLPNPLNLNNINGTNGFVIHGENAGDVAGTSVSAAGDINGDGIDDVIIGAEGAASSYIVFGNDTIFANSFKGL